MYKQEVIVLLEKNRQEEHILKIFHVNYNTVRSLDVILCYKYRSKVKSGYAFWLKDSIHFKSVSKFWTGWEARKSTIPDF